MRPNFSGIAEKPLAELDSDEDNVREITAQDIRQLIKKDKDYPTLKALVLIGLLALLVKALTGFATIESCKPYVMSAYNSVLGFWHSIVQYFSSLW